MRRRTDGRWKKEQQEGREGKRGKTEKWKRQAVVGPVRKPSQTRPGSGSRPFRADLRVEEVAGGRIPVLLSLPGPPVSSVLMDLISRLQMVEASLRSR